jgi:hypothetical protein
MSVIFPGKTSAPIRRTDQTRLVPTPEGHSLAGMVIEVVLESEVPEAERTTVAEAFESAGIKVDIQAAYIRRGVGLFPWIIDIVVVGAAGKFIWAALGGAGDEAGRDGWKKLKALITSLYEARRASRAPQGGVALKNPESRVEIQLPPDLPDDAYRRLWEIDNLTAPLSGILKWDNDRRDWIDVFTGQYQCFHPSCTELATQSRVRTPEPGVMQSRLLCEQHAAASDAGDPSAWN